MLSQNSLANPLLTHSVLANPVLANTIDCAQSSNLANTLFDLGDCFGNLCRIPLESAFRLFQSSNQNCTPPENQRLLTQQLHTSIPFAVSREWQNQVWSYQVSLHTDTNSSLPLHQHLGAKTLTSIPAEHKTNLKEWLYFASPLDKLLHLDWQLLSAEQLRLQRLQHLSYWLKSKLEQGRSLETFLLVPLTDLPLGDGLNQSLKHSFARIGKQSLPNQQRLSALNYAVFQQGKLIEGYGLQPNELFQIKDRLNAYVVANDQACSQGANPSLLILDQRQCLQTLAQLDAVGI